jgi:hypothetical protein
VNDDDLKQLLLRADEAVERRAPSAGVADRVRVRFQARRRRRRFAAAAAVPVGALAIAVGVWRVDLSRTPQNVQVARTEEVRKAVVNPPARPIDVAAVRAEIARLNRECADYEAAARAIQRTEDGRRRPTPRDALDDLQWQREQAALVLVRLGDRLADDLNKPASAAVAYRQARDTFPDTRWASVAEERLARAN